MFTKEILEKYADVVIWGLKTARGTTGGKYKKGDVICIIHEPNSLKLAEVLHKKLLEREMHVVTRMTDTPKMEFDFFNVANEEQLKFLPPWNKVLYKHLNGLIWLEAPKSLTHLTNVNPKKIATLRLARKSLKKTLDKREQNREFGWTLCVMPTKALAKQAGMSFKEYGEEIIRACYLDRNNPVEMWENLLKKSVNIGTWLNSLKIDYIHIESENIDLKITIGEKRKWKGVDGNNIPSFEIFTSPDWRGAEGIYCANIPSFENGTRVECLKLTFKKGRAVKIEAKRGEEFAKKQLATDKGANRLGEIAFVDKRFSPITKFMATILFDENMGGKQGNCHIAVGDSYIDTYSGDPKTLSKTEIKKLGFNDSAIHWDLINTERKRVTAHLKDGKKIVIYEDGMFKNY